MSHNFLKLAISHVNSETNPPPAHYQYCLQVSETVCCRKLRFCYFTNMLQQWLRRRDLIYFCKVDHSRIFINFPGIELVSIIYVWYCHKIRGSQVSKIGSYLIFLQFLKNIWGTCLFMIFFLFCWLKADFISKIVSFKFQ